MEKKQTNVKVLDELNKGSCMGKDAILFMLDKVEDKSLRKEMSNIQQKYQKMIDKISDIYKDYSQEEPHKTSAMNKVMTWYGIEMKTMMDDTTSKIAELLLQGTNMGIIEGRKLLNNKEIDKKIHSLIEEYVDMQEEAVEIFKKFL